MQPFDHIVLAIPHATEKYEESLWSDLRIVGKDVNRWTDWHTDALFSQAADKDPRARFLFGRVSRFDCDLERLAYDPLEKIGQGRLYKRSHSGATRTIPTGFAKTWLEYWREWRTAACHLALDCPRPILLDCHSFPSDLAPDVDVCLGFNEDATKPEEDVLAAVRAALEAIGLRVAFNVPYGNAFSPEGFPGPSLLVELNKALYMDERWTTRLEGPNGGWERTVHAIRVLCDTLLGGSWSGDETTRKRLTLYDAVRYVNVPSYDAHEWGRTFAKAPDGRMVRGVWWRTHRHIEVKCIGPFGPGCAGIRYPDLKFHSQSSYLSKFGDLGDLTAAELLYGLISGCQKFSLEHEQLRIYKFSRCAGLN